MNESDFQIPFYGGNYLLKRINSNKLSPLQKFAFDITFPWFQGSEQPTEKQLENIVKAQQ